MMVHHAHVNFSISNSEQQLFEPKNRHADRLIRLRQLKNSLLMRLFALNWPSVPAEYTPDSSTFNRTNLLLRP
jgi:hypothetical protein